SAQGHQFTELDAPQGQVAIVFGAAINRHGGPSTVLRDRLDAAVQLYHDGKISKLLMTGSHLETGAMQAYAIGSGIPDNRIMVDLGGLRTYDSCYRARNTFGIRNAILITQAYHLPRALYVCTQMGIKSQGVFARESRYWRGATTIWQTRETLATLVALWDVHISKPIPSFP
ncbi:MAG: YdcF family protein, partial [Chloroflexota bacterium]